MRDSIGKNIALGMAKGISQNADAVMDAMAELEEIVDVPDINTSVDVTRNSGAFGTDEFAEEQRLNTFADAIVDAFVRAGIGIEVDDREFGRIVRKVVLT
jgi:hypothetical protein